MQETSPQKKPAGREIITHRTAATQQGKQGLQHLHHLLPVALLHLNAISEKMTTMPQITMTKQLMWPPEAGLCSKTHRETSTLS